MIVQFGTSRFLQAHVDLFAWEASLAGQDVLPIAIVQVSGDSVRAARLKAFNDPEGYPVLIRGLEQGEKVERQVQVCSVKCGLSARRDWDILRDLFVDQASYVVSNSGDAGYEIPDGDRVRAMGPPSSFCAILLELLHLRWAAGAPGVTVLPCELVAGNGTTLRAKLLGLAGVWDLGADFLAWLDADCMWINTLVDRIVSKPLVPAGAIAEPYALWAIEDQPKFRMPFAHPAIAIVEDLERHERLKLHILNLGHSWLAEEWVRAGADPAATVRGMLDDPGIAERLGRLYEEEVVPGFAVMGWGQQARDYVGMTLERFANPYLEHRLADIHCDHAIKVGRRITAFVDWVDGRDRDVAMPQLRDLARCYGEVY